jgi:hypothetical protein
MALLKNPYSTVLDQKSNNEQQISKIKASDFTLNPTSDYIKGKVEEVFCCSSRPDAFCELDHNKDRITVDELASRYYGNLTTCFQFKGETRCEYECGYRSTLTATSISITTTSSHQ